MTKVDRLPRARLARLSREQRDAYERLRWHGPAAADRARLKLLLGWKRTREETLALADELLAEGLLERVVAAQVGVSGRYLHRLLADKSPTPENAPFNRSIHAADLAASGESDTGAQPGAGPRRNGRGPVAFASFADLDRWLEERRA